MSTGRCLCFLCRWSNRVLIRRTNRPEAHRQPLKRQTQKTYACRTRERMKQIPFFLVTIMIAATSAADVFTYEVQMAGYAFDRTDQKGEIGFSKFIAEFRAFPWLQQLGKANGGSEATLSVLNRTQGIDLWVSIAGNPIDHAYIVGFTYPKNKISMFGLISRNVRWLEMYVVHEGSTVEELFGTFFKGEHEQLRLQLGKLEKFDEMEARN